MPGSGDEAGQIAAPSAFSVLPVKHSTAPRKRMARRLPDDCCANLFSPCFILFPMSLAFASSKAADATTN